MYTQNPETFEAMVGAPEVDVNGVTKDGLPFVSLVVLWDCYQLKQFQQLLEREDLKVNTQDAVSSFQRSCSAIKSCVRISERKHCTAPPVVCYVRAESGADRLG